MLKRLLVLLLLASAAAGYYYYWMRRPAGPLTLTGIVTEDGVVVSSQVAGRLNRLLVKEGDQVREGQLLAVIEAEEMKADQAYYTHNVETSTAAVEEAESALRYQEMQTRDQIRQAEAALAAAQAQQAEITPELERARLDYERSSDLLRQGIVPPRSEERRVGKECRL